MGDTIKKWKFIASGLGHEVNLWTRKCEASKIHEMVPSILPECKSKYKIQFEIVWLSVKFPQEPHPAHDVVVRKKRRGWFLFLKKKKLECIVDKFELYTLEERIVNTEVSLRNRGSWSDNCPLSFRDYITKSARHQLEFSEYSQLRACYCILVSFEMLTLQFQR